MEALATELGALTPEQAAAPVNTVEVSGGGRQRGSTGRCGKGRRALPEGSGGEVRWKETTSLRACAELPPTCLRRWARGRLRRMRGASAGRGGSVPQGAELARLRGGRRPPVCPACILQTRAKRCLFSASVPLKFANCLAWGEGGGEGRVSGLFGWAGLFV